MDVIVRGAGIFGLGCAWAMARRGARVCVVDPFGIGAGSSGGIVGALAPHVPENWNAKKAFQLASLLMAERWWAEIAAIGGTDPGYARTGRLQPIADAAAVTRAQSRTDEARVLWQGRAAWAVTDAAAIPAPWRTPSPSGLYIHDTLTARIHPRTALAALAAAVIARGGDIVTHIDEPENTPTLWATGVAGLRALGVPRPSVKGQALLLRHDAATLPQLFVDALHIVPHADGTVAIGSTSQTDDETTHTDARIDDLHARAIAAVPTLADAPIIERWAGLRPRAPSRAPLLGGWPDRPGHYIANGGFKIGFGMAPKIAEAMADLILNGQADIPAEFGTLS